jgi:aryl-alcohol dehydrogenase-like predicted oxidoreductase
MRYRALGSSGIEASVVAFGAWAIGGWRWGGADEAEAVSAIHAALDAGVNLIDTAPMYGFGRSEELVGRAIRGRRDRVVLATKCGLRWDTDRGVFFFAADEKGRTEQGAHRVHRYLGAASIRQELETSLRRLGTDHVDLYQTHWQDPTTPLEEVVDTLLALKREGKIRAIGACNAGLDELRGYAARGALDTDQERYSMIARPTAGAQTAWCGEHRVAFLAYSPLHHGLLTGKLSPDRTYGPGDLRGELPEFRPDRLARVNETLASFAPIAARHRATTGQLVVAWTLAQPGVSHALVGARTAAQARENAAAGDIVLSPDELAELDRAVAGLTP